MAVGNGVGINPEVEHFLPRPGVIVFVHGVGENELGFPFGGLDLQRDGDGRANQNSLRPFLGDHLRSSAWPPRAKSHPTTTLISPMAG